MAEEDTMTENPITYKGAVRLSKVKYQELENMFKEELSEEQLTYNYVQKMLNFKDTKDYSNAD